MEPERRNDAMGRAILFDLDGTIMDSQEGILWTMRQTLTALECEVPKPDDLFGWIGPPFPSSLRRFTNLDDAGIQRAVELYRDFYDQKGSLMSAPFPGMVELIENLHQRGVVLGLATSKPRTAALRMLKRIGIDRFFDARGCASDDETRGTKEEVISDALAELAPLGIGVSDLVMVGDRIHDFEAASALGIKSIAVTWGYGDEEERQEATIIAESVGDLALIINNDELANPLTVSTPPPR
jgi:phosphoglycolate phosphatase